MVTAAVLIGLVLMQHGKGADMGAAFGSGSAGSLFGSSGSANFLSRSTAVAAAVLFATSLGLTYIYAQGGARAKSVMDKPVQQAPAAPAPAGTTPAPASTEQQPASRAGDIPK
jgi:preprotein translocase subunit SecG